MRLDRIEREKSVLVDVINCRRQPDLNDTSMMCQTIDVSEEGMQFSSELDLPVNTRLGLRLDLETSLYRLEGEVRWASARIRVSVARLRMGSLFDRVGCLTY